MHTGVARGRRYCLRIEGSREMVLVGYPWARAGIAPDGCEVIEGFLRPRRWGWHRPELTKATRARRPMTDLTHVDATGQARMVDVSEKSPTLRFAKAGGCISMRRETLDAIRSNSISKGDVVGVARLAGIMAAKKTADLVPLCHQVPLSAIDVDCEFDTALPGIRVTAAATTNAQTGVEMEAIMAVSVTLITLYDMAKGVDRGMEISEISLLEKRGGRSGEYFRDRVIGELADRGIERSENR